VSEAVRQGVQAVLPIDAPLDFAISAIRLTIMGASYFPALSGAEPRPPAEASRMRGEGVVPSHSPNAALPSAEIVAGYMRVGFTLREAQVLATLERGLSNKAIAKELKIADKTVKAHLHTIMRKLNANNRTEAILQAQERIRHRRTNVEALG
jgi:DNA-binding NarL/FixJ family response regulator